MSFYLQEVVYGRDKKYLKKKERGDKVKIRIFNVGKIVFCLNKIIKKHSGGL